MNDSNNNEWTQGERERLRSLSRETTPPPGLEDAVVSALHRQGLLRPERAPRTGGWRAFTPAAAAAVVALLLGTGLGLYLSSDAPVNPGRADSRPRFVLLLRNPPETFRHDIDVDRLRGEYAAWGRDLAREGRLVMGEELDESGTILSDLEGGPAGQAVSPEKEFVSGFFLIRAADFEEARRVARTLPHLRYGGKVEVRALAD